MRDWLAALLVGSIFVAASISKAEGSLDPLVVGEGIYSFKSEDPDTRILEANFKPGQKVSMHEHPKHVVYVLSPGSLRIQMEGEDAKTMNLKAGQTIIMPAQKHWAENIGKTQVKLLVVEIKGK